MDAVQRMRQKAQSIGNLKSTEQQVADREAVGEKTVIVIEMPPKWYVPSHDPLMSMERRFILIRRSTTRRLGHYAAGMASPSAWASPGAFWGRRRLGLGRRLGKQQHQYQQQQ